MKRSNKISDQLITAILNADISRYEIAKLSGVSEAVLSRFVNHKRIGMSLDSINKVCEVLTLELTLIKNTQPKDN